MFGLKKVTVELEDKQLLSWKECAFHSIKRKEELISNILLAWAIRTMASV